MKSEKFRTKEYRDFEHHNQIESAKIESINLKAKSDLIKKISNLEKSLISNYTILDYTDMMAFTDELLGYKESTLI